VGAKGKDRYEQVTVRSRQEWRAWLAANHTQPESIWLVTYKKHMGELHLPYADIVEEALCFGWIDSLPRALDEERTMLLVSPRRRKSVWSELNRNRVARLTEEKSMTPAGLAKVERAKADGSWAILENLDKIPADLVAALAASPRAAAHFKAFSPSARRGILAWIKSAKKEVTRIRRIKEVARLAARNLKPGDPRAKPGAPKK
jgi:uncharacterized protein YdeI (YjbR/CyaY-like superfamily)